MYSTSLIHMLKISKHKKIKLNFILDNREVFITVLELDWLRHNNNIYTFFSILIFKSKEFG